MKISIKKYLLYSSVFAIFTEAFFFHFIIDWKLLYLIVGVNYLLLFRIKKITVNIYFVAFLLFLFVHGLLANTILSIPYNFMLSQIIGITIIGTYYYNLIPLYKKEEVINVYLKTALFVAIIGYPLYFLNINLNSPDRLQSVFKEPAHYAIVVIPACYYYLKTKNYLRFAIIFGTLILSNSSLGYIGCGLMFIVPNLSYKRFFRFIIILPFIIGSFYYVYHEYSFFKLRFDDTVESLNAINTGNFKENANLSSYSLLSNMFVAKKNVTEHTFGSGIGSHVYMHKERYLHQMNPPKYLVTQHLQSSNASDANSMFVRIISELGIIGFLLVLFLLIKAYKCFSTNELYFAQGIFIYLLLKLFRDGHYFPPELFFFIWLFYSYYKTSFHNKLNQ